MTSTRRDAVHVDPVQGTYRISSRPSTSCRLNLPSQRLAFETGHEYKMTGKKEERELSEKVRETLAEPDWALRFPEYSALPHERRDQFFEAEGKSKTGRPTFLVEGAPTFGDQVKINAYGLDEDEAQAMVEAWSKGTRRALRRDSTGGLDIATIPPGIFGVDNLATYPRLKTFSLGGMPLRSPKVFSEQIIQPLRNELGLDDEASTPAQPYEPSWDQAAPGIMRLVALDAAAQHLVWSPRYFQFSIEELVLRDCDLGSGALVPLGRYVRENRNLIELDLKENHVLVRE